MELRARGDGSDQAGRSGRAQGIAVPTFKPDPGEMRSVSEPPATGARAFHVKPLRLHKRRPAGAGGPSGCVLLQRSSERADAVRLVQATRIRSASASTSPMSSGRGCARALAGGAARRGRVPRKTVHACTSCLVSAGAGALVILMSPETVFARISTSGPSPAGASLVSSSSEVVSPLTVVQSRNAFEPRRTAIVTSPETEWAATIALHDGAVVLVAADGVGVDVVVGLADRDVARGGRDVDRAARRSSRSMSPEAVWTFTPPPTSRSAEVGARALDVDAAGDPVDVDVAGRRRDVQAAERAARGDVGRLRADRQPASRAGSGCGTRCRCGRRRAES